MPIPTAPKSFREQILLAQAESTYGVDAAPTGIYALRCYDVQVRPLQGDKKSRSYIQPFLGARPSLLAMQRTEISFKVEACGSLTAGTLPAHHDLLRACALNATQILSTPTTTISATATYGTVGGTLTYTRTAAYAGVLARTVTATCTTAGGSGTAKFTFAAPAVGHLPAHSVTNVTLTDGTELVGVLPGEAKITPTVGTAFTVGNTFIITLTPAETRYERQSDRTNHGSVSLHMLIDNERHRILGARGTVKLVMGIGEFPYFEFAMTGYFATPDMMGNPVTDYSDWTDPVHISTDSTNLWLSGKELVANNAELDLANTYSLKERIGRRTVRVNDWATKFTSTIEAPELANLNLWDIAQNRTRIGAQVLHGRTAGNTLFLDLPSVQIDAPSVSEDDADYMLGITADVLPVNGDDELKICFR